MRVREQDKGWEQGKWVGLQGERARRERVREQDKSERGGSRVSGSGGQGGTCERGSSQIRVRDEEEGGEGLGRRGTCERAAAWRGSLWQAPPNTTR